MSKFHPNKKISRSETGKLEELIGFRLPQDYENFLVNTNGGYFCEGYPQIPVKDFQVLFDSFFGIGLQSALDLEFWHKEMEEEIPEFSLLIGKDPGGAFFLICCSEEDPGVYYYDHSYQLPESTDEQNSYLICKNFEDFKTLIGLKITE